MREEYALDWSQYIVFLVIDARNGVVSIQKQSFSCFIVLNG